MRVGWYTAQLFVKLTVTKTVLTISSGGRSYRIGRENFKGYQDTSVLGIFKRGIRFHHSQPNLANPVVFYPSVGRESLKQDLIKLGWS
ncbi:hypothetical protein K239x_43640 [Planctomycetes bacterium K23_9]|uniref:Uncharacterized protein n=2 Tax=Stieleria marina TaxID=1930275 RepID=A0A517NYZ3_9BACT|nr:hypothetical protein K239x_43640 [Planctomycetes bacterium K23_9]